MGKKVVIVGAGIIGLSLADELASSGIETTVYESKPSVSHNAAKASGIFSKDGLSKIGIEYADALVNTLDGAVIHGGGESFRVQTGSTKALVLDRGILAELCAKNALESGAAIILNSRLGREDLVQMSHDKDTIIAGADGAVSSVASAFDFPKINEYVLTYKAEYTGASINDMHKVELFFSNSMASRFFGWTVPYTATKLEVGIGISTLSKKTSTAAFARFLNNATISEMVEGARKTAGYASIIPLEYRKATVLGNVLLVGDSAGQVKATTGGGVIFGVSCAKIAARAIIATMKTGAPLANYESMWRRSYGLDLRLHRALHGYYSGLGEKGIAFAIRLSRLMGFEKFLSVYGDMDSPKLMLKRFFLRRMSN